MNATDLKPMRTVPRTLALRRAFRRLALVLVGLSAAGWIGKSLLIGAPGIDARLALLGTIRVAYPMFLSGLLVVGLGLTLMLVVRGRSIRLEIMARGLAIVASIGLAVVLAETAAGAYLSWLHRFPTSRAEKAGRADGSLNIVVIGESSAEGVPYRDWLSVGKVVAWQVRRAIPSKMVRLEVQARPGWTLEQMHQRLVESRTRADVVIVYAGHNEFASRFGWSSVAPYYRDEPPTIAALARWIGRFSPMARLVAEFHEKALVAAPPRPAVRGLVDVPSHTTAERSERLADFRRRLEGIVACCEATGALPVLVIPPGNDAGFEPNRSVLPPGTTADERRAFARAVESARLLEADDPRGAIRAYRDLIGRQPGFAEAHFRLARLLGASGDPEGAYRHYVAARDADGHPMRCPTDFQDVYREVAARRGTALVDGQAVFHGRDPRGMLDDALFNDAMHPSFEGHVALAEAILAAMRDRRALGWPESTLAPRIDPAECAEHFDVNRATWAAASGFAASFYRTVAPIRYDPAERLAKAERYGEASHHFAEPDPSVEPALAGIGLRPAGERDRRVGRLYPSDQPLRQARRRNGSASGALVARREAWSHSSRFPAR